MGKKHSPSAYRKIIKASKSGKEKIENLIAQARALEDDYYASLALFSLSLDSRLELAAAQSLRSESLKLAEAEEREWRRAELTASLAKAAKGLDISGDILHLIEGLREPKAKAEAISDSAKYLECGAQSRLLEIAAMNKGSETESCKPVIKHWARECPGPLNIINMLDRVDDTEARIKLLGYLQLQLDRNRAGTSQAMKKAVALALEQPNKLEILKYLALQTGDLDCLMLIASSIGTIDSPVEEASLLTTLAGSADKAGDACIAIDWFNAAARCLEGADAAESAQVRLNLAVGYGRLGDENKAADNFKLALENADNDKLRDRIKKAMGTEEEKPHKVKSSDSIRHVLALHDTYEGGLSPVHLKMLATAAPLCIAYELDLALIDFPEHDLATMVKKAAADTNIGKGGRYLQELADENRIIISSSGELDEIGLPVATTSRPQKGKETELARAAKKAKSHPRKRLCVIMGLGKKGLPKTLLDSIEHHAEMTGSNVPLETSTAMGIIAQAMGQL